MVVFVDTFVRYDKVEPTAGSKAHGFRNSICASETVLEPSS